MNPSNNMSVFEHLLIYDRGKGFPKLSLDSKNDQVCRSVRCGRPGPDRLGCAGLAAGKSLGAIKQRAQPSLTARPALNLPCTSLTSPYTHIAHASGSACLASRIRPCTILCLLLGFLNMLVSLPEKIEVEIFFIVVASYQLTLVRIRCKVALVSSCDTSSEILVGYGNMPSILLCNHR